MKKIVGIFVASIILIYGIMFINTNNVLDDFKELKLFKAERNKDYGRLYGAYYREDLEGKIKNVDLKCNRIFVVHNFKKGMMVVRYSNITYDYNDEVTDGNKNAISKWYIEKKNGRWVVVDIDEKP